MSLPDALMLALGVGGVVCGACGALAIWWADRRTTEGE